MTTSRKWLALIERTIVSEPGLLLPSGMSCAVCLSRSMSVMAKLIGSGDLLLKAPSLNVDAVPVAKVQLKPLAHLRRGTRRRDGERK